MDYRLPFSPDDHALARRPRGPVALSLLAGMIVVVLGAAAIASASTEDTRDFKAKHSSVLATRLP